MQLAISMPDGSSTTVEIAPDETVKSLKVKLQPLCKLPPNKQKLKAQGHGFLKDAVSISTYGLVSGAMIQLEAKTRGGR
jgi:hypothetical protein|eukprot:SAG25_NODE_330_length_9688_cov_5.158202_4_plen_79_part_00